MQLHHPIAVKHVCTRAPTSSPSFFFCFNAKTNGPTSFGALAAIASRGNFDTIFAFMTAFLADFLELLAVSHDAERKEDRRLT